MIRKFASLDVLDRWLVPAQSGQAGLSRVAHRVAFDYEPRPGFLYVRSRMISSRTNDNHDTFPAPEIEKGYKTFLGKPVFVNHNNANHRRARGVIVAVALHRDRNPDSSPDTWVEGLMEIDALRFPRLAQAILARRVNRTSMGVDVDRSTCSACGNEATSPAEYCNHIPAMKGKKIRRRNRATGKIEEKLIHEVCAGLSFFENSLLVEDPADPTCHVLDQPDASGLSGHMPPRTAGLEKLASAGADSDNVYHLSRCHHTSCGRTLQRGRIAELSIIEDRLHHPSDPAAEPVRHVLEGARSYSAHIGLPDPHAESYSHVQTSPDRIRRMARAYDALPANDRNSHAAFSDMARQVHDQYHHLTQTMGINVQSVDHDPYKDHLELAHDLQHNKRLQVLGTRVTGPHSFFDDATNDKFRAVHDAFGHAATGRSFDRHGEEAAWLAHSRMFHGPARHAMTTETRGQNSVLIATGAFAPQKVALMPHELTRREAAGKDRGPAAAYSPELDFERPIRVQAAGPRYPDPADHPWFQANPVHKDNITRAYHETTDDEKALGERWYSDAHHVAKAITGGNAALGAGLLSAYSPQTAWPINMFNASRAAQGDPPGPGSGAMGMHQKPAMRMLAGEHHSQVLRAPKTAAFAHLIEHGDDTPEDKAAGKHKVVVDRHAMSVAVGRRLSKEEGSKAPLDNPHYYNHVRDAYRDSAADLSQHYSREVKPHEVQAATWLGQIRKNQAEDRAGQGGGGSGASKGRVVMHDKSRARWHQHHQEQHPGGIGEENMHYRGKRARAIDCAAVSGRQVTAYGETRVPSQVDTLRTEECPVCGESDVWSGSRCPVCGFIVPPSLFRDPDVTKAQQVRDELDQTGEVMTQPGAPGDPSTEQIGSGADAESQLLHPDQVAPDGVPAVQGPGGAAPAAQLPGQEEEEAGDEETEEGEEDQARGAEEEAEGQELAGEGEEDQLSPGALECPACGTTFAPDMAAQPGVPCPACRQGSLEPAGGPQKEQEDPSGEEDEREDMPGSKTAAALMQAQASRIAELMARNEALEAQLGFLAKVAGCDQELAQIGSQVMQRHADMLNPASPVPDPPEGPPTETTEQALNPETMDDPSRPGTTPGSTTHVPAAQTTTSITPGVEIQTPPATNLVDVTAPVTGTNPSQDGGVPLSQRRIETDVRVDPDPLKAHGPGVGGQGDNGSAFPWVLEAREPGQQRAAARQAGDDDAARTYGSLRLARLRIQAGLAQGEDIVVAEGIRTDASLSTDMIAHEIDVLGRIQPATAPQRPMPRQAVRSAPSLASMGASHYAPAAADDLDASDIFV